MVAALLLTLATELVVIWTRPKPREWRYCTYGGTRNVYFVRGMGLMLDRQGSCLIHDKEGRPK